MVEEVETESEKIEEVSRAMFTKFRHCGEGGKRREERRRQTVRRKGDKWRVVRGWYGRQLDGRNAAWKLSHCKRKWSWAGLTGDLSIWHMGIVGEGGETRERRRDC